MNEETMNYRKVDSGPRYMRRFSWQPVLAGMVATFATQIILGLIAAGMGLGSVSTSDQSAAPSVASVGLGASLWAAVSVIVGLFYGGFIAARLAKSECHHEGILHGIAAWAGSVVLLFILLSTALGGVISGTAHTLAGASGTIAMTAGNAGPEAKASLPDADMLKREARDLANGNNPPMGMTPDQAQADMAAQFTILAANGEGADKAHRRLVADLGTQGITPQDAEARVNDWQQKMDAAKRDARIAADKAAHVAAKAAFAFAIVLLIGAFTSALGGSLGALHVAERRKQSLIHNKQGS